MTFTTTVNESYLQCRTRGLVSSSVGNSGEICLATAGVNITVDLLIVYNIGVLECLKSDKQDLDVLNEDCHFFATYCLNVFCKIILL